MIFDWAKVWTDMPGDPKLMRAAREGHKGLELLPWFITFAKGVDDNGRLSVNGKPAEPADFVPLFPGQTRRSIARALESLEAIGVLDRDPATGMLYFAMWEVRQERAPSDMPEARRERVRACRAKRKAAKGNGKSVSDTTAPAVTGVTGGEAKSVTTSGEGEESRGRGDSSPSPSPQAASVRLRDALPEKYRPDLDALLTRVLDRPAWEGELRMAVEGGTAGAGVTYEHLGQAIHDFLLNGKGQTPEILLLRRYITRAASGRSTRPGSPRARSPAGAGSNGAVPTESKIPSLI